MLGYLDDYKKFYIKASKMLRKNGSISIFASFNETDYDTNIRYKKNHSKKFLNPGLSTFSLKSHNQYLKKKLKMQLNVERFKMSSVLKKNKKNTFQSYSLGKNNELLVNDLNLMFRFYHISAKKNLNFS